MFSLSVSVVKSISAFYDRAQKDDNMHVNERQREAGGGKGGLGKDGMSTAPSQIALACLINSNANVRQSTAFLATLYLLH